MIVIWFHNPLMHGMASPTIVVRLFALIAARVTAGMNFVADAGFTCR